MDVAFVGVEAGRGRLAPVVHAGIGHVRLQQDIGGHAALQRPHGDAQDQGLTVRVGEDLLVDGEAPGLVRRRHAIGGRQGAALGVLVQVVDGEVGVGAFDRQAAVGHDGQTQLFDLGLVDQAVHGLGQDAVGDGEPDLGHGPGRPAVAIGAVDIGLIGRACAHLGGIGPVGVSPGAPGAVCAEAAPVRTEAAAPARIRLLKTRMGKSLTQAGVSRNFSGTSRRPFHDASLCWAPGNSRVWKSRGP